MNTFFVILVIAGLIGGFVLYTKRQAKKDAATPAVFVGEPPADSGSNNPLGPDAPNH